MTSRAAVLRAMYQGADDESLSELALSCGELPQPESLERFVRRARVTGHWHAAVANALSQLFDIDERWRRL